MRADYYKASRRRRVQVYFDLPRPHWSEGRQLALILVVRRVLPTRVTY